MRGRTRGGWGGDRGTLAKTSAMDLHLLRAQPTHRQQQQQQDQTHTHTHTRYLPFAIYLFLTHYHPSLSLSPCLYRSEREGCINYMATNLSTFGLLGS